MHHAARNDQFAFFWHRKPINLRSPRVVHITVLWRASHYFKSKLVFKALVIFFFFFFIFFLFFLNCCWEKIWLTIGDIKNRLCQPFWKHDTTVYLFVAPSKVLSECWSAGLAWAKGSHLFNYNHRAWCSCLKLYGICQFMNGVWTHTHTHTRTHARRHWNIAEAPATPTPDPGPNSTPPPTHKHTWTAKRVTVP